MLEAVKGLKEEKLWFHFGELTKIPRSSKKEEKIMNYLVNLAKEKGLNYRTDDSMNLVVEIPASPGYENVPCIVLQGHTDMVCEKNSDSSFDFDNDPIEVIRDGEFLRANKTTLGADNGIGVAMGLAIADTPEFIHGPVELLMTVDEETGLTGAKTLKPGFVKGNIMINLDSEEEGALYAGCAGGLDTEFRIPFTREEIPAGAKRYNLMIKGLVGGHSGLNINEERGCSLKIAGLLLYKMLTEVNAKLTMINGGNKRNAIPREAEMNILIDPSKLDKVKEIAAELVATLKNELPSMEKNLEIVISERDCDCGAIKHEDAMNVVNFIYAIPHGVMGMSCDIPELVETSTNLGVATTEDDHINFVTSQRSSIDSAKMDLAQRIRIIGELCGAEVIHNTGYPGWKPDLSSKILDVAKRTWTEITGKEPEIKAIHAGLECGIIGEKFPGMDMVSLGPDMFGVHTPDEKLNIKSAERIFNFTGKILKKFADENK